MLSKIQFVRITDSKFKDLSDTVLEELRENYPLVQPKREVQSVQIDFGTDGQQNFKQTSEPMLSLISANKEWGVVISPENLILHTKNYGEFDQFEARMKFILGKLISVFKISHTSFLGMRFLNTFNYFEEHEFRDSFKRLDFLQPEINDWGRGGSSLSARYAVSESNMININSGVMINAPKLPPDLMQLASELGDFSQVKMEPVAHLDIDSFCFFENEIQEFTIDNILKNINNLRVNANDAFHSIVKLDK